MRENDEHKLVQVDVMIEKTILLMMFTLIGVITFIWMKLLGNKLRHLERATEKFGAGDFSIRVPASFRHSVGNLNVGFNQMASKIEKLLLSHKQLSHNIAHELRTPIFKIQMQLELLEANSNAKQQKYITGIEDDLFYLQDLVDELLQYAQAERAELKIKRSNFKVNALINSVIDNLSATTNQNINFKSTQDNDLSISADINLVARIISNLLSNAIKYGLDLIEISVESYDKRLLIHIDDNGNGVAKNDIESIFEPFYQVDSSHNGYGLGLSLAREIAKLHNGSIKYQKSPLSGARFTLALPLAK
jgi:two-component system sensor histidine kinase RstB